MIDHVKTLLLDAGAASDGPADAVLALFGIGVGGDDADIVDRLLPLALAPDLRRFRRFFDRRVTPSPAGSVYSRAADGLSPDGLWRRVLASDGRWLVSALFRHDDREAADVLADMRAAAFSHDAPYALGAVLLACAYRRWLLWRARDV
jgi:hypothetical protein